MAVVSRLPKKAAVLPLPGMCVCGADTASYGRLNHLGVTSHMRVGSSAGSEKAELGRRGNTAADRRALKLDMLGVLAARPLRSLASHLASQHTSRGGTEARTSTQIGFSLFASFPIFVLPCGVGMLWL